jgi:hypothetical protein
MVNKKKSLIIINCYIFYINSTKYLNIYEKQKLIKKYYKKNIYKYFLKFRKNKTWGKKIFQKTKKYNYNETFIQILHNNSLILKNKNKLRYLRYNKIF